MAVRCAQPATASPSVQETDRQCTMQCQMQCQAARPSRMGDSQNPGQLADQSSVVQPQAYYFQAVASNSPTRSTLTAHAQHNAPCPAISTLRFRHCLLRNQPVISRNTNSSASNTSATNPTSTDALVSLKPPLCLARRAAALWAASASSPSSSTCSAACHPNQRLSCGHVHTCNHGLLCVH